MPEPLDLSYQWWTPAIASSVIGAISIGLLASNRPAGWLPVAVLIGALWLALGVRIWLRTRAYLRFDGPLLAVRRYRGITTLDGRKLHRVREYLTVQGPCYRVWLAGDQQPHHIPAALLRTGHSRFFDWVLTWAPQVDLDAGCRRTIDRLRTRGLLE